MNSFQFSSDQPSIILLEGEHNISKINSILDENINNDIISFNMICQQYFFDNNLFKK